MSDLERADCGDIMTGHGVDWEVIGGISTKPQILLQRVGLQHLRTHEHTRQAVIVTSNWASNWKFKEPLVDPVLLKARELLADSMHIPHNQQAALAGHDDDTPRMQSLVDAIRAGMALARGEA